MRQVISRRKRQALRNTAGPRNTIKLNGRKSSGRSLAQSQNFDDNTVVNAANNVKGDSGIGCEFSNTVFNSALMILPPTTRSFPSFSIMQHRRMNEIRKFNVYIYMQLQKRRNLVTDVRFPISFNKISKSKLSLLNQQVKITWNKQSRTTCN